MRSHQAIMALMPLVASATLNTEAWNTNITDIEVVSSIPTLNQLHAAYPKLQFLDRRDGRLELRDRDGNFTIAASTVGYRFTAGTIAVTGYYSLGGGANKVNTAINACSDNASNSDNCVVRVIEAAGAHMFAAAVGLTGGKQFVMKFWSNAPQQAQELMNPVKRAHIGGSSLRTREDTCTRQIEQLSDYDSPARFDGTNGLKIAGKNFCFVEADADDISYTQAVLSNINQFRQNEAFSTDFTIFDTSSSTVVGRYHVQLDNDPDDLCPLDVPGGDGGGDNCQCSGC